MNQFLREALDKLSKPVGGDRYAKAMAPAVCGALKTFCQQSEEFAQAVAQGGEMSECLAAVARKVKNGAISDLDAYKAAAEFFFPGCVVEFQMQIRMSKFEASEAPDAPMSDGITIDLADFL